MSVLVAKVSFSLAPETGEDLPSHASLHALPNPDPVSHHVHLFCSGDTETRSSSPSARRAALPCLSASLPRRARFSAAIGARSCLLVRSRAYAYCCAAWSAAWRGDHSLLVCEVYTSTHIQWQGIRGSAGRGG